MAHAYFYESKRIDNSDRVSRYGTWSKLQSTRTQPGTKTNGVGGFRKGTFCVLAQQDNRTHSWINEQIKLYSRRITELA